MFDSVVDKLTDKGVKVNAAVSVDDSVYIKLAAAIIVAAIAASLGSAIIKSLFTSK
jgi:hypothetical protein